LILWTFLFKFVIIYLDWSDKKVMIHEENIEKLAIEIAKCYAGSKTMLNTAEYIDNFLDVYDVAKERIRQREKQKEQIDINAVTAEEAYQEAARIFR